MNKTTNHKNKMMILISQMTVKWMSKFMMINKNKNLKKKAII